MAPGDVCHGVRCSLAGLRPVALGYRPCCWPVGSAGSPQCVPAMGCWFFPVPRPPYVCTCVRCPGPLGSYSSVCALGALFCLCGVLGHLAPLHRCARAVCRVACAVSWATWLLFTNAPARCNALLLRCPGPLGSCSLVCPLKVLCCICSVMGHLAPVHRCARSVGCFASAVSWATWLLFTSVPARRVVLRVRCPGPRGTCSPVCQLGALLGVCGILGHLAPVHRCAHLVRCFVGVVSWATWLLFTGVPARCVALGVRCPGPLGSCSLVCLRGLLCCVCGVLGHLAPVHRCARSVCCFAAAVSSATWLLFTDVPAWGVVLRVRCPGPLGSCSRLCVVLRVRCPAPLGPCSPVCPLGVLCCVCGVLGHLAPVHRCARSVRCCAGAVSWATWLLFTGVLAPGVVLCVRCPGPLGSCSPVCPLRPVLCSCGVLGHLAPVHQCARSVCCVSRAVSLASWLLFTGVPARCALLRVQCPWPPGSYSPVCSFAVLCLVCGVLGLLAPVHRCASSVCCAVGCVCGASLRGAHSSIRTVAICSRQGLGSLPGAHSSNRTAAVRSRQGLGTLRARTRLSGRRLFRSQQGLGLLPGAHTSGRTAAGVAWHLSLCLGCGRRRASLACLVAPRGAPRLFRSGRSRCSGRLS